MTDVAPRKRPLVRWPFLLLADIGVAIVWFAWWFTRGHNYLGAPASAPAGRTLQSVEGWAILVGILAVMTLVPTKTYRFLFIAGVLLAILAVLIL